MKKVLIACLTILLAATGWADGEDDIALAVGGMQMVDARFPIQKADVATPKIATAVIVGQRQLQVTGKNAGSTDVFVSGNGQNWKFTVTVVDNRDETLSSLARDLGDAVPELECSIVNGSLKITGKIKSIAKLKQKNRILAAYKGTNVRDLSTFQASPEVMIRLKKSLEHADFKVVENQTTTESGTISIIQDLDADIIRIKGKVYSDEQKNRVKEILDAEPWLKDSKADKKDDLDNYKVAYQMDVEVENITIQVDVLHIGLTKQDCKNIGLDWESLLNSSVDVTVDAFRTVVHNSTGVTRTKGSNLNAGISLSAALGLMARNNVNHIRRMGFVTLKSNGNEKPSRLHQGGTVWVSAPSTTSNNNTSELKEVAYGMQIEAKGGMTKPDKVKIDLKQEVSYPIAVEKNSNVTYELKKSESETTIECGLGEAVAIIGVRESEIINNTSGSIPYLRNVPVLRWMVAQDRDEYKEMQILTLVSVRQMGAATNIDPINEQLLKMKEENDNTEYEKNHEEHVKPEPHPWWQFWKGMKL